MLRMTRRVGFSAAHADGLTNLSRTDNEARLDPEAGRELHGHNYTLDVGVEGEIDPQTGLLVNIKVIDQIMRDRIVQQLGQKFIDRQVPAFTNRPTTPENLARFIADELQGRMPPTVRLTRVRLEETPQHWVEWHAQTPSRSGGSIKEPETMLLTRAYEFAASHRLHSPHLSDAENQELFGKCNYPNGHGHNYELEVTVSGPIQARSGRVMDAEALDAVVHREVVDRYDHRHFNYDIPEFEGLIPSAEVITRVIWERLRDQIPAPARLHRVLLRETARNIFEYRGEEEDRP